MILKKYSPKGKSCRITFEVSLDSADSAIAVVGDFNDWDYTANPMKRVSRSKVWRAVVSLKPGSEVQFRYLSDKGWLDEKNADGVAGENAVLSV